VPAPQTTIARLLTALRVAENHSAHSGGLCGSRSACSSNPRQSGQRPCWTRRSRSCRRARVEDRIRCAKDTGLTNLPLHDTASNRVWIAIVLLAVDLLTWTQTLALSGPLRAAEPKTLRHRLLAVAGRIIRTGRRLHLRLDRSRPWATTVAEAVATLRTIPDQP
jgi:hypothetical protein